MRDRRLQGVEAIVERKQRVLTEGDDNRFLFNREHRGRRRLRSHSRVSGSRSALPLGDRLRVDPVVTSQRPYALLTMLYRSTHRLCRAGAPVKYLAHNSSRSMVTEFVPLYFGTKHLQDFTTMASESAKAKSLIMKWFDGSGQPAEMRGKLSTGVDRFLTEITGRATWSETITVLLGDNSAPSFRASQELACDTLPGRLGSKHGSFPVKASAGVRPSKTNTCTTFCRG